MARLVSVVLPAHNSAATIDRALQSALAQDYRPLEIIVVDDCSQDNTADIVLQYSNLPVKLIKLSTHSGASGARNAGIMAATGDLVAFLDADDEWLPSKISRQMQLIEGNTQYSFVFCSADMYSEDHKNLGDLYRGYQPTAGEDTWKALLVSNFVATPSVLVWRHHLVDLGGFDKSLKIGEDQDMWIRLALRGPAAFIADPLVRVYVRPNSLSSGGFRDQVVYTMPMIERHIAMQADRLSRAEIRTILGERLRRIGWTAYSSGAYREGASLIFRSIRLGHRPAGNLLFLLMSAPPVRWLKQLVRSVITA